MSKSTIVQPMIARRIESLNVGKPAVFRSEDGALSSMARQPVDAKIWLSQTGLAGDAVADSVNHGGVDKAIHLYPLEHYEFWRKHIGHHPLLSRPGAFGENISAFGMAENQLFLGDRFRMGDALVELSHGRQPCWKINHRFGNGEMVRTILQTGRCGLYFRVLEEGALAKGDGIERVATGDTRWTISALFELLIRGQQKGAERDLAELAVHPALAEAWRARARSMMR